MNKHRKIDKHFGIIVNNQSVKILKFKMDSYYDDYEDKEINTIELITKIPHDVFNHQEVLIDIDGVDSIKATWCEGFSQPGLKRYKYKISK
ncbi:hypothetical protein ACFSO7_08615 [Bacillus sp. CGMCC 1.16607]|uniref:hypothetical protein n=1 Tax=Bacillus sp. CGMCC 1.16607 TaxID=3351842 RepID=UPI00363F21B6